MNRRKSSKFEKTIGDKLVSILTPEQHKRLKEISVQVLGAVVLLNPEVAKQLEITEEQKQRTARRSQDGGDGNWRHPQYPEGTDAGQNPAGRKDFDFDAMAILTAQQRDKFEPDEGRMRSISTLPA